MPKERSQTSSSGDAIPKAHAGGPKPSPQIPAAELLSFLKEIRGLTTWTEKELAKALKIGLAEAKEAVAVLQLQGYIEPAGHTGKWRVAEQGDLVSGAKSPRFTRQSVEETLAALRDRIKAVNQDPNAPYRITEAIAFGDFLTDAARVQAADIRMRLARKGDAQMPTSAKQHAAEVAFLKQLRAKTPLLNIQPYEDWMASRTHRSLL
jgi:hypothetical protein